MKKLLKTLLLGSLMFTSLIGCDKEETGSGDNNNENNTTDNIQADPVLTGITINTIATKTTYTYGDTLDLSGLSVVANYDDNSTVGIKDYVTNPTNGFKLEQVGNVTVTVTYEGKSGTFDVTVDKALVSIELDSTNAKTEFNYGDKFTSAGLVVKANFNDGTTEVINSGIYVEIPEDEELLALGNRNVLVTYGGKSGTYQINVSKNPSSITADATYMKQNYKVGEKLDLTGLRVTAHYPSGTTESLNDDDYTTSIAEDTVLSTGGKFDLVVTYLDKTDTVEINVVKTATKVDFNIDNAKLYYHYGDQLDLTGLVVTVTYDDGSIEVITDYSQSVANGTALKTTEGSEDIIIAYGQFTYTVTIEVDVGSCWLNTSEMKTVYNYGEALNTDGLRAFVRFGDGETEDLVIKGTEPENGAIVDTIDQYFYVIVTYVDNTGRDEGAMLALPVRFADETGTHGRVDLSSTLSFSGNSAPIKAVGTRGSNFRPVFYFKPTTLMESTFESNMQRTIFKKDYELYNYDSIGGITSIRVNGGEDNYDLYVGYTRENMYKFLESTADGDSRIYSNIPNVNYMKIVGKSNEQPAYISSVEFDYTRDDNHNIVSGARTNISEVGLIDGSYELKKKTLTINGEDLSIGKSTFTYTGIVYKGNPLFVEDGYDTIISVNCESAYKVIITDLTNLVDSPFTGTYENKIPASYINMLYKYGQQTICTNASMSVDHCVYESFEFSAFSDAKPEEPVSITLFDQSAYGETDEYAGDYTPDRTIAIKDRNNKVDDFDLTIKILEIEKSNGQYLVYYEDQEANGYIGNDDVYTCVLTDGIFTFGDENLTIQLNTKTREISFTYIDDVLTNSYLEGVGKCTPKLTNPPTAKYENGVVTCINPGTFYLECSTSNGLTLRFNVTVKPYEPVEITLNELGVSLEVGQTHQLSYDLGGYVWHDSLTFSSSNTDVATVDNLGNITAVSNGEATITITTIDDIATINVYVGTTQSINSIKYTFEDDEKNKHTLVLIEQDKIIIDGEYMFLFDSGDYIGNFNTNEVLLEFSFNGTGLYICFIDAEDTIFSSTGPIKVSNSSAFKLTLVDEATSSASTGQSISDLSTIEAAPKGTIFNFSFTDAKGVEHQLVVTKEQHAVLDNVCDFYYIGDQYLSTNNSNVSLNIDLNSNKFVFRDRGFSIFGPIDHCLVKTQELTDHGTIKLNLQSVFIPQ